MVRALLDAVIVKNQVAGAIERVANQPAVAAPKKPPAKRSTAASR